MTHYSKTLGTLNPRYELFPIVVTYYLASIAKMGCKDNNNNNATFVKVREVVDEDDESEEQASAVQDL